MAESGQDAGQDSGRVQRHAHPGRGGRAVPHTKGRQLDADAQDEMRALLGDAPRRRDLLIEHLHLIQDRYGCLSADHLVALADEMRMALTEVYEVATFYAHFDVVTDERDRPPPVTIRVCDSIACEMMGSEALLSALAAGAGPDIRILRAPCMGACDRAPAAAIGHAQIAPATKEALLEAAAKGQTHPTLPDFTSYDAYLADGGYELLRACRDGKYTPEDLIAVLDDSGLRGLGGAGFPAGRKWTFVRAEAGPRLMAVNADEGEPGTFKDRWFLGHDPHRFLEGMLIAAWAIEAETVYIYLRDEYPELREVLISELAKLEQAGLTAPGYIHLRRGAGAYICGEESAMLESIEGKRGLPRHKPPFPAQIGLFGRPTLIHNIETLYWIRDLVQKGADWFTRQGRNGSKGFRTFSVSGRVKEPGVKIAPAGITVRELIAEFCGGMQDGHVFKGYLPGGASGGILPASMGDEPLDFGTLEKYGSFIGSAAVVVLSDQDSTADAAINLLKFFEDESCGQCTPCRNGCEKAVQLLSRDTWDVPLLEELSKTMGDASICGLGQAAANPFLSVFKHFPEDVK
ncbi:MAG: NADH:ubiquinone oxidoreductase subunit F (NADH-binding)/NADH:ubiquinone oxidoreductase subunit E [Alphaproteobacteria bacterium]|jgi:NADH:ubiquinone oxidoreductase subunit F (NADH-binding)/NADH:ubiquinone oxidoreductase subunit E